ncbi:acyl-CoA synthetase (AMP-forming) / AMP-acid ligase II [Campylobacter novaezeelandiae]|uniref:ANL family adenylate-forming protein n=1 Tax=Campylobacter novaezeelandiae TaxID=2267891 RepID=UPI001C1DE818|nr:fatty acid--CoA ligase family protein [Campylobacter novaezeelandiae]QWU79681.1 acyl-CoA synthetase (AMP-forming) / AMP-acid ligase II [Campylobacter novaezeelandiae]
MAEFNNNFLKKIFNLEYQDHHALIYENKYYTYKQLRENTLDKIEILKSNANSKLIVIIGDYDCDSVALLLACIELNKIAIPLIDEKEIDNKLKEINCDILFKYGQISFNNQQNDLGQHRIIEKLISQNKAGLILFSSGSTGKPKVIVHDLQRMLNFYIDKKYKYINILLFLMFDHIGGLNTLLNCLSMNACGIAVKDRKNVNLLAKSIEKYKISLLPASPSLLNLFLISNMAEQYDLSSLRLVTYGTEKMPETLLEKLKIAFPKVKFLQTFGTSEIGITQTKSYKDFIKLENVDYKIIDNELFIKSNTQSLGYLNADNSVFDNEGYFRTGDLVEVTHENGEEYIKIIGRNKEMINIGGEKVLPQEVEGVILQIPFIQDCLVYSQKNPITGQAVCAKIVLKQEKILSPLELKKQIRLFCKDKLANYKIPIKIEIVERLEFSERFKKIRKY